MGWKARLLQWTSIRRVVLMLTARAQLIALLLGLYGIHQVGEQQKLALEQQTRAANEEKRSKHYQAWQAIIAAQGKPGSGGRILALEELCADSVSLAGVDLSGGDKGAYLVRLKLPGANLQGANLARGNLEGANLIGADLSGADLHGADLHGANLMRVGLSGADLRGANLQDANLVRANLRSVALRAANLENADLEGADLFAANLEGANLSGVILSGANVELANFQGTIELTCDQIISAVDWGGLMTWIPDEVRIEAEEELARQASLYHLRNTESGN